MKVSSKIEICNLALARIEQNSISSFEDDKSIQGQFCRMSYEQSKSSLLSQYNWTFAIKRALLKKLEIVNPIADYRYIYALPEGFLRLISVYHDNRELIKVMNVRPPYIMEGQYIYSDYENCQIKFVFDLDEVSYFSPLFIDCFILDLSIRLTKLFNSSSTYLQQLLMEFSQAIEKAKISDCQQEMMGGIMSYPLLQETAYF